MSRLYLARVYEILVVQFSSRIRRYQELTLFYPAMKLGRAAPAFWKFIKSQIIAQICWLCVRLKDILASAWLWSLANKSNLIGNPTLLNFVSYCQSRLKIRTYSSFCSLDAFRIRPGIYKHYYSNLGAYVQTFIQKFSLIILLAYSL